MAIATDGTTPSVITSSTSVTTLTTASFSPPADSLVIALVASGRPTNLIGTSVITDSGTHTWTVGASIIGAGAAGERGLAVISYCYFASAPGSITVTNTFGASAGGRHVLAVRVLTGANASQVGAGSNTRIVSVAGKTTVGTISITTTVTDSLAFGVTGGGDPNVGDSSYTLNGATTLIGTTSSVTANATAWRATAATATPGATTLGGTWGAAASQEIAVFEVLPAGGAPPVTSLPPDRRNARLGALIQL